MTGGNRELARNLLKGLLVAGVDLIKIHLFWQLILLTSVVWIILHRFDQNYERY